MDPFEEKLAHTVEMLLNAAVEFSKTSITTRLPRLIAAICDMFDADGCLVTHPPIGDSMLSEVVFAHVRTSQTQEDRIRRLQRRRIGVRKPVLILDQETDGGPAIVVLGAIGEMVIYRQNPLKHFNEQDAQLIGSLWRFCGSSESCGTSPLQSGAIEKVAFSPRVRQVLTGLLDGLAEKQIASELGISRHTVHVYVKNLHRQLGVNTRSQLLLACLNQGITSKTASDPIAAHRRGLMSLQVGRSHTDPTTRGMSVAAPATPGDGSSANRPFG